MKFVFVSKGLRKNGQQRIFQKSVKKELTDIVELQEFYTAKKDADNIKNMDSKFHEIVYNNCGSIVLSDILHQLHRKVIKYRKASVTHSERAFQSTKEHRMILDSILEGNGELAEKLTIEHIENARGHIKENC